MKNNNNYLITYTLVDDPNNVYEEEAINIKSAMKRAQYIRNTYVFEGEIDIYDSNATVVCSLF